jgi:predicted NBD/HSP70 family sugar kinase
VRYLGIDIGGTSVKLAAMEDRQLLWTGQSDRYARPDTPQLIAAIRQAAQGRAVHADGVGLCVPGLLDKPTRTITLSVNVPGLNDVNLDRLVLSALGEGLGPILLTSDALATAYDLYLSRKLKGRLLSLCLGTGIGAAVLDDGIPLRVDGDTPGHFGQVDVSIENEPVIGPDGGSGSLEGYLGMAAFTRWFGTDVVEGMKSARGDEPPFLALARAIRIGHAIYRPNHVALAGGVGIRLGHLLDKLRKLIDTRLTNIARPGWTLCIGESDFHAARGAAQLAGRCGG